MYEKLKVSFITGFLVFLFFFLLTYGFAIFAILVSFTIRPSTDLFSGIDLQPLQQYTMIGLVIFVVTFLIQSFGLLIFKRPYLKYTIISAIISPLWTLLPSTLLVITFGQLPGLPIISAIILIGYPVLAAIFSSIISERGIVINRFQLFLAFVTPYALILGTIFILNNYYKTVEQPQRELKQQEVFEKTRTNWNELNQIIEFDGPVTITLGYGENTNSYHSNIHIPFTAIKEFDYDSAGGNLKSFGLNIIDTDEIIVTDLDSSINNRDPYCELFNTFYKVFSSDGERFDTSRGPIFLPPGKYILSVDSYYNNFENKNDCTLEQMQADWSNNHLSIFHWNYEKTAQQHETTLPITTVELLK